MSKNWFYFLEIIKKGLKRRFNIKNIYNLNKKIATKLLISQLFDIVIIV